jgi:probable rRNA maturation factor
MILIKNRQKKITIDVQQIIHDAQKILSLLRYDDFDIGIWLTTNKTIKHYNKQYRHKDRPTDILSFPYHTYLKPPQRIVVGNDDDKNLGDLIISLEYVKKDLPRWNHTFEERMRVLLIHGICHLLGYDHELEKDYSIMKKKENQIFSVLSRN